MSYNVLAFIHGIMPDLAPRSHAEQYAAFWQRLVHAQPKVAGLFPRGYVGVEWGHPLPGQPAARPDERVTDAQAFAYGQVNHHSVKTHPSANNVTILDATLLPTRLLLTPLREEILLRGVGDAIYYCSAEGEGWIRRTVYAQVLEHLEAARGDDAITDVRLHVISHSLGVTIAHDFLYGLFNTTGHKPDFPKQAGKDPANERYAYWRGVADGTVPGKRLQLGSFTSFASQLPLFLQRSQAVVDKLAAGEWLDPTDIGIRDKEPVRWQLFYDLDDLLSFATRPLYSPAEAIRDVQVDSGDNPATCHSGYWTCEEVVRRTAELLAGTAAQPAPAGLPSAPTPPGG